MTFPEPSPVAKADLFAALPPPWDDPALPGRIAALVAADGRKVVALDDDPTGSQTVHDIAVLTRWPVAGLAEALRGPDAAFYILTNSRSLPVSEARALTAEIAAHLARASQATGVAFDLVSRSDSTLRGHYPAEIEALAAALGEAGGPAYDGHLIIPFFEEGGRFTIGDVHWVAEGERLVPAGQTEYAHDPAFGYHASNLRAWVAEKSGGRYRAEDVLSISLDDLRRGGPERAASLLMGVSGGRPVIVNCAAYSDLQVFVAGLLAAEARGKRFLFRTAASFVKVRSANPDRPLLAAAELGLGGAAAGAGGLVVVGSYIHKSGEQLAALLALPDAAGIELDVATVLRGGHERVVAATASAAGRAIAAGRTAVVYTSRGHVTGANHEESLRIASAVSAALVEAVQRMDVRPRFIVAKGGITSSDVATRGLGVARARVLGQLMPGVSAWRLGPESRYPGLIYVVFPGNVGGPDALAALVSRLLP